MASTVERGYGGAHQKLRRQWAPKVERGEVACWRCGRWIVPGSAWHMGHDDWDRSVTHGPEHALCNLRAAGKKSQLLGRRLRPW